MKVNNHFNLFDMQGNPKFQGVMTSDTRFNLSNMSNNPCYYGHLVSDDNFALFNILDFKGKFQFQWKFENISENRFNVHDQSGIIFYGIIVQ